MCAKRTIDPSAGYEGLRNRAVLWEGDRERARRGGRPAGQRARVDPHSEALPPLLAEHAAAHNGFLPRVRAGSETDSAPKLRKLTRMQGEHGELVMLTWLMHRLDALPLKSEATALEGRKSIEGMLRMYAPRSKARAVALQRGGAQDCTHAHVVVPLAHLVKTLQATALAAPAGKGGGAWHLLGRLHIVRVSPDGLERVAGYLARDPDGRFDLPEDHPAYLQAHAEEIERKRSGRASPRLSW